MKNVKIKGASLHNLKNIDVSFPKGKLTVVTGISGSGKSSLVFDILFEEGKNQYLSALGILNDLKNEWGYESLEGIGPTVAVKQNTIRQSNPRSTVGSKTGLLQELALIYASEGQTLPPSAFLYTSPDGMCVACKGYGYYYDIDVSELVPDHAMTLKALYESRQVTAGFLRLLKKKYGVYFNRPFHGLPEDIKHQVLYGVFENGKQSYCIERNLKYAKEKGEDIDKLYKKVTCSSCHGSRIGFDARDVLLEGFSIGDLAQMTLTELLGALKTFSTETWSLFGQQKLKTIVSRLNHLIDFSLGHLTLYREMPSLSGGELQRVFLHHHLASKLDSLIYVLDEPMSGLHPSEKSKIIEEIKKLRDLGNTIIVVDHDFEIISQGDHIIEIGPGAGVEGGDIVYEGSYDDYLKMGTKVNGYLEKASDKVRRTLSASGLTLSHVTTHHLKDLNVSIPLNGLIGIAGPSGSGKSSLIEDTLVKKLITFKKYGDAEGLTGYENVDDFIKISQAPIGKNASSMPASYIGIWQKIRELFAEQSSAIEKGMNSGYFSFNSKGACQTCGGSGYEKIFLTTNFSVNKRCKACDGKRFNQESLAVLYRGKTIDDVLNMSLATAEDFFEDQKSIVKPLKMLNKMGMGYLKLGQPTTSLSGGESQRIKLSKELGKKSKKKMLYILDEPTTGLSVYDTALLLNLLDELISMGHSIIVIEHDVQVLRHCDYIIELGPEGGEKGGYIVGEGTPETLIELETTTGRYLR